MEIGFNKFQVYAKLIFIIIASFFLGLFISKFSIISFGEKKSELGKALAILGFAVIGFCIFLALMELLFLPNGVKIDPENKSITLFFFTFQPKTVTINSIISYTSTIVWTRAAIYKGVFMNTQYGKKYLIADFNLKNYKPVEDFLNENNIYCDGTKKFNPIQYLVKYL